MHQRPPQRGLRAGAWRLRSGGSEPLPDAELFASRRRRRRCSDCLGSTACTGGALPAGYLTFASRPDCDDANPNVSATVTLYRDGDFDGVGAGLSEQVCTLVSPRGYSTTSTDCDDANDQIRALVSGYVDSDEDTYGTRALASLCTDGTLPKGYATRAGDCAPDDPLLFASRSYSYVDRDGDGKTVPESGTVCTAGALPDPYRTVASGKDCDDTTTALTGYEVIFNDGDGDGVGAGPYSVMCLGSSIPAGTSRYGDDVDDADAARWEDEDDDDLLAILF